jgi:serine/threonine-protein kinase
MNLADATNALEQAGFVVSSTRAPNDVVDKGLVAEQSPSAGNQAAPGSTVRVVISDGPQQTNVEVPDVVGLTRSAAQNDLTDLGLKVAVAGSATTLPKRRIAVACRRDSTRRGRVAS